MRLGIASEMKKRNIDDSGFGSPYLKFSNTNLKINEFLQEYNVL